MLTSLTLKNFKAIHDIKLKNLKKINVFIGPNNAGKSSFLQSIALIAQSIEKEITYKGKMIDLGSFEETIFGHQSRRKMSIGLSFEINDRDTILVRKRFKETNKPVLLFGEVDLFLEIGNTGINSQAIFNRELKIDLLFNQFIDKKDGSEQQTNTLNKIPINFRGNMVSYLLAWSLRPFHHKMDERQNFEKLIPIANELIQQIKEKLRNIYYFSTMRAITEWGQELRETDSFGSLGEDAISMLHHVFSNDIDAFHRIEKWIKKFGLGTLFSPIKGSKASILLGDPKLGIKSNLISHGFGVNQLISVIGQCFASPKGSIIMIEEPEISLHPGAINVLTDMFLEVMSEGKQIMLSTHSDRLILELWARVKLGLIDKNDVNLYLIEKTEKGAISKEIELNQRIEEMIRELKSLYKPKSPLDELLKIADESGDKDLSKKDLSEI